MIYIFFKILPTFAAAVTRLILLLPMTQVKAAWLHNVKHCGNETVALYDMDNFKLDGAASNYTTFALDSIAGNITEAIVNNISTITITRDMSYSYSDVTFAAYRDSCFIVDGMVCFADFNADVNISNDDNDVKIKATIYGFPFCAAPSCTKDDLINATHQILPGAIVEKSEFSMNFSLDAIEVNCHFSKC
jgi:hypothetical protein